MTCTVTWATITWAQFHVHRKDGFWKKPIWRVEAHNTAKVHGEVLTRYSVAVAVSPPFFTCTSDSQAE